MHVIDFGMNSYFLLIFMNLCSYEFMFYFHLFLEFKLIN